ncbi:MAG TPA: NAD-dependent succinate-semialdehyde dehydrogenase [Candidatus Polarisedimenticolaceae bacterium]|nr:NAD-dependent succinate-semialdehyde dehydrogenase [Candidatus Polarisedimenticolaceae bacterium]
MTFSSVNPATGQEIQAYSEAEPRSVESSIQEAHRAWTGWRETSFERRASVLRTAAQVLRSRKGELARLMASEMGKPVKQGEGEVEKCAWACEHFAEHAERYLAPDVVDDKASVVFQPLGLLLAVMPWNFPLWQVFRFAAPALMAGNVGLLKHASNVPGCALAIEDVLRSAGLPEGAFRTLLIGSGRVKDVIEHALVRAVTLTGSTPAGKSVAALAGGVVKKTVLELGGSDAYVVLEDADLARAVEICVAARLVNAGQSCIAAKRFVVVEPLAEEFTARFVARMKEKRVGDPLREDTDVGPLARHDLRDALHAQVTASIEKGARLALGGTIPDGPGAFYPPTVLADVKTGMPAYDEELFGPVAAIVRARDEDDAVRIANDSIYGLGAAVFTQDLERGKRVASRLEAGCVCVNAQVVSDPRLPFGGVKQSGYGRELGAYGIREFVNVKTIILAAR